ncbi:MAG TPA: YciI family protein, partial [Ilumatobacteraceae bacterium]
DSAHRRGILVLGGALADPADGVVFVFRTENRAEIEEFVHDDPYVRNGLVTDWRIRQWNVAVGQAPAADPGQTRSGIW